MKITLISLLSVALMVGCTATSKTQYQKSRKYDWGFGVGVSEVEIKPGVFRVTAAGYSRTDLSEMTRWVTKRAEELCGGGAEVRLEMPLVAFHRASSSKAHPDQWVTGIVKCHTDQNREMKY